MDELSEFLNFHYVESEGADFRLAQSTKMLQWAYMIPGYKKEQFIVIRNTKSKKIMANFMLHPMRLVIMAKETNVSMTNFLAVHSKLRNKKMAQIMILEAIRRSRAENL